MGVPRSTRILDLHLEANVTPLAARFEVATAYQAEKYRRHPIEDPLYTLAHAVPPNRLKRRTWQHVSDEILERVSINPSHPTPLPQSTSNQNNALHYINDGDLFTQMERIPSPLPMHYELNENDTFIPVIAEVPISLEHRQPMNFTSQIAPWQSFNSNITIIPEIKDICRARVGDKRKTIDEKRKLTEEAIAQLGSFDLKLWTDGSVMQNGHGGSACISLSPIEVRNPYKKQKLTSLLTVRKTAPAGRICCPADTEYRALDMAFDHILEHKSELTGKRIFVGTDAQSILKALKTGPHRRYKYLAIDTSPIWKKINEITLFCKELVFHYVPGHVDILGNTYADNAAKFAASQYSDTEQNQVAPTLSNLKSYLKQKLFNEWCIEMNSRLTPGFRHFLLKARTSRLKMRVGSPRPIQTLFSRYRCNRSESCGEYPRKLRYIMNPSCRFCGHPKETILHLLDDCPGTHSYG